MGKITIQLNELFEEAGVNPMDLTRHGIAQGTAYNLAQGRSKGIRFDVLEKVCSFFTQELGRPIGPGDILKYEDDAQPR